MQPSQVVILGHSGFIGRNLHRFLTAAGHAVLGASTRDCDLTDQAQVRQWFSTIRGPFALIHAAVINRAEGQSAAAFFANCRMMENVLEGLPPGQCRAFIYLSSVDVYGAQPQLPVSEESLAAPSHYYALAKLTGEGLLRLFPGRDFPAVILRLPGIYGGDDNGKSLLGTLIRTAVANHTITVTGDGTLKRDLVCIEDLAALVAACLDATGDILVNVATGTSLSLLDIIALIAEKAACRPGIEFRAASSPAFDLRFDTTRLTAGWPGIHLRPLSDGISSYLATLR